ncbi:hypothetical protein R6Q59_031684 [Mikania micrantha]
MPLSLEFDYSFNQFRAVGENYQLFVRLVSNEVDRHAPFHYQSWQEVPGEIKMSILITLHRYFDLQRYYNTESKKPGLQNMLKFGGRCTAREVQNIMDEKNKSMSSSDGDDTPVNEVAILERSLGQRRGHIRGVGRTVKSVTSDVAPSMSYTPHNQDLHDELRQANACWQEQQEINIRMQQQINELMSRQKAFDNPFDNTYKPTFEEEEDDDDESECDFTWLILCLFKTALFVFVWIIVLWLNLDSDV